MYDNGRNMMGGGFQSMSPEDIFAMGIKRGLDLVKELGRNGDTELAHVTPQEQQMLQARGGAGTVNPRTGLPEFFGGEGGGGSMGRDDGRVGGGERDDGRQGGGRAGGVGTAGVGGGFDGNAAGRADTGSGGGRAGGVGTAGVGGGFDGTGSSGGGVSSNPSSAGGTVSDMEANRGQSNPPDERDFGQRIADGLAAVVDGWGFGPPTGKSPGLLGSVIEAAIPGMGIPMGFTRFMQGMGVLGEEKQPGEIGTDEYSGQRDDGVLSPNRRPQQQGPGQQPASSYAWTRPGALPSAPMALGLDPMMTPLQMRSRVATGGTAGDAGIWRDPTTLDFYKQLAFFDLTQPGGAPRADATPLPVELQYLTQMGAQPGDTTESFLKALSGLNA